MASYLDIVSFFMENQCGFLATVDNGMPRLRPWSFLFEDNGKIWFMTTNTKRVFKQLQQHPYIEFCSTSNDFVSGRIGGKIELCNEINIKTRILEERPMLMDIYKTPENPVLETFYLEHGNASLYSSRLKINDYFQF